jgi:hypothetical protein
MERSPKKRRSAANKAPQAERLANLPSTKPGSRNLDSATTARIKGGAGTSKSQVNDINSGVKVAIDL